MTLFASLLLVLNSFSHPASIPFDVISAPINDSTQRDAVFSDPVIFEDSILSLYNTIGLNEYNLSYTAFRYGMIGYFSLEQDGKLGAKKLISIIDFTKPSSEKRFYTIDLEKLEVKYHTYVSHGKNTGWNTAESFSNVVHSNASSLGFYITAETYVGSKGYSLKLDGQDKGYNDNMRTRAVVMHEADYVNESWIKKYGRLGRSQGCPALPKEISKKVIDSIKHHTLIFAYSENKPFLNASSHLKLENIIHSGNSESVTTLQ
jgi:hypothetical protein